MSTEQADKKRKLDEVKEVAKEVVAKADAEAKSWGASAVATPGDASAGTPPLPPCGGAFFSSLFSCLL